MMPKVSKNRLTLILVMILSAMSGALASQFVKSNIGVKGRLVIMPEKFFSPIWLAQQTGASVNLIMFAFLLFIFSFWFVYGKMAVEYTVRVFRTLKNKDAHSHHFLIGSFLPFAFVALVRLRALGDYYKWKTFEGDALIYVILAGLCGVLASIALKVKEENESNENEIDLYDRKNISEYLERRIRNTFESSSRKLPESVTRFC